MFADLAVDRLFYLREHLLPCAIHHALDHLLMVGEILQMLGDELSCCPLLLSHFFHRFHLFFSTVQRYEDLRFRRLIKPSNKLYFSSKTQKIRHFCLISRIILLKKQLISDSRDTAWA